MKILLTALFLCSISLCANVYSQEMNTSQASSEMMDHSHMPIAVPNDVSKMSLSLSLVKDAMSGYNLTLLTKRYVLTPPPSNMDMSELMGLSIDNQSGFLEGHAHLYINGDKIQRIYGPNIHLPETLFKAGTNSISVTLNNHGHMYWTIEGKKVVSTLYVDRANNSELIKHKFESFPSN